MKAAVNFKPGTNPEFVDFEEFHPKQNEVLVKMKAVAIKNLDKMRASGTHYSLSFADGQPKIAGTDGVGNLENGTPVYVMATNGSFAEKIYAKPENIVKLPENIDPSTAAALPNALMGSVLALKFRAKIKKGDTVLINGVTGITGKVAVQVAQHLGAGKIIGTGRNAETLTQMEKDFGIETIILDGGFENFSQKIKELDTKNSLDIVIDYLWGKPAETILVALKGKGKYTHLTQFVTVGNMAGETINLPSGILRSTDIVLSGSGLGSWTLDEEKQFYSEILPEMFALAAEGKLSIPVEKRSAAEVNKLWANEPQDGSRAVYVF